MKSLFLRKFGEILFWSKIKTSAPLDLYCLRFMYIIKEKSLVSTAVRNCLNYFDAR